MYSIILPLLAVALIAFLANQAGNPKPKKPANPEGEGKATSEFRRRASDAWRSHRDKLIGTAIGLLTLNLFASWAPTIKEVHKAFWDSEAFWPVNVGIYMVVVMGFLFGGTGRQYGNAFRVMIAIVLVSFAFDYSQEKWNWFKGKEGVSVTPASSRSVRNTEVWRQFNTSDMKSVRESFPGDTTMWNIAACESSGQQFSDSARTKSTLGGENPNATGIFQILRTVHSKLLDSLSKVNPERYDINTLQGNIEIARVLRDRRPRYEDWAASQDCWGGVISLPETRIASRKTLEFDSVMVVDTSWSEPIDVPPGMSIRIDRINVEVGFALMNQHGDVIEFPANDSETRLFQGPLSVVRVRSTDSTASVRVRARRYET